jgi:hypothetical protein
MFTDIIVRYLIIAGVVLDAAHCNKLTNGGIIDSNQNKETTIQQMDTKPMLFVMSSLEKKVDIKAIHARIPVNPRMYRDIVLIDFGFCK